VLAIKNRRNALLPRRRTFRSRKFLFGKNLDLAGEREGR
jgi:hypothetical protein